MDTDSTLCKLTPFTTIVPYAVRQTDISGLFYFKFILEIRITDASGTLLGKIKQKKSPAVTGTSNVTAVFDVRDIVNTQLETQMADYNDTTKSIHTLGVNDIEKPFSQNTSQLLAIYVKAYQEYSESATASPTVNASENVTDTLFYIPASLDLNTARSTASFQTTGIEGYKLKDVSNRTQIAATLFGKIEGIKAKMVENLTKTYQKKISEAQLSAKPQDRADIEKKLIAQMNAIIDGNTAHLDSMTKFVMKQLQALGGGGGTSPGFKSGSMKVSSP